MDVNCEGFHWTYTRIAYDDVRSQSKNKQHYLDKKVDGGIEDFFKNLSQIGPELLSVSRCVPCLLAPVQARFWFPFAK